MNYMLIKELVLIDQYGEKEIEKNVVVGTQASNMGTYSSIRWDKEEFKAKFPNEKYSVIGKAYKDYRENNPQITF